MTDEERDLRNVTRLASTSAGESLTWRRLFLVYVQRARGSQAGRWYRDQDRTLLSTGLGPPPVALVKQAGRMHLYWQGGALVRGQKLRRRPRGPGPSST